MQQSFLFKSQSRFPFLFDFTSIEQTPLPTKVSTTTLQCKNTTKESPFPLTSSHSNIQITSSQSHRKSTITCARKRPRRTKSTISARTLVQSALFLASNLGILPEPVNLILKEGLGGDEDGGGGGLGSWNRFGGGGFGEGRPRRKKLGFFVLSLIVCGVLLVVLLGEDFKGWNDLGLGVMLVLGLAVLERVWKRGAKGWILGICSCALMGFLGLRREDGRRWNQGFSVRSAVSDFVRRSRRIRVW